MYLHASGIIADLVIFCVVSLRVSADWEILSTHPSLRSSAVVLYCLFSDRNVSGILTSFMVSTCALAKYNCCVVLSFEIISATIRAAILSDLYFLSLLITARDISRFLSLLLTASDISRFLSLFMVNISYICVAVISMPTTRCL